MNLELIYKRRLQGKQFEYVDQITKNSTIYTLGKPCKHGDMAYIIGIDLMVEYSYLEIFSQLKEGGGWRLIKPDKLLIEKIDYASTNDKKI